jgi:fluoroquinolone resistance protein
LEISFDANAEYVDKIFRRVNFRNKTASQVVFDNCTFIHSAFQETIFEQCKFRDCTFQNCDLQLVRVTGSSFRATMFKESKVTAVNWAEGAWSKQGLLESIGFIDSDVSYATFIGLDLTKMALTKCTATNADFAEANLTQADCTYTNFIESRFLHTNLTEADFTNARNYAIDVSLNVVKKTKFSLPEAVNLLRCMDIVLVE